MFSVVVPVYNRCDLLRRAIESVFAQEFTDYELIVVDDGSTEDIAACLGECGGHATLLRQNNSGPGAARNLGIANASGEYVAFLDSDDVWFPWTLRTICQVIRRCGRPSLIAGCLRHFHDEAELASQSETPLRFDAFQDYLSASQSGLYVSGCQAIVRRDVLLAVGGMLGTDVNAEDHDLALRLGVACGFVFVRSPVTIGYRRHATSLTSDLSKTLAGVRHLIDEEKRQGYPGGSSRRPDRRRVIGGHVRPASLALLAGGRRADAWQLFRASFLWHVREARWRYIFGFPARALVSRANLSRCEFHDRAKKFESLRIGENVGE